MPLFPTTTSASQPVDRQTQRPRGRRDSGTIFIKDVKSSNDTLINGEQLSQEGVEFQLKSVTSDAFVVEFGIDYPVEAEGNKTTNSQSELYAYLPNKTSELRGPSNFNSIDLPGAPQQRRIQLPQQGSTGLGSMGNIRPPGKSGLSFDLIFSRLQDELQKSKDTGEELHSLTTALSEIQDTLGGSLPQGGEQQPPSSAGVTLTHSGPSPDREPRHSPPLTISPETLLEMQVQLQDTRSFLAFHTDNIRSLESIFAEQESLNQEIESLNQDMRALRGLIKLMEAREKYLFELVGFKDDEDSEEDDAKSVGTATAGEDNLERIDEEDKECMEHRDITDGVLEHDLKTDKVEHQRQEELGRPKTPEPMVWIDMHAQNSTSSLPRSVSPSSHRDLPNPPDTNPIEISQQVFALSEQVKVLMAVKSAQEAQHVAAQAMIQALENKFESIEALVKDTQEQQTTVPPPPPPTIYILVTSSSSVESAKEKEAETSPTEIFSRWKKSAQGQWNSVQEDWSEECGRLNLAREDKMHEVDAGLEKMASLETSVETVKEIQASRGQQLSVLQALVTRVQQQARGNTSRFREHDGGVAPNGEAIKHRLNGGLVTPPSSPRSRSSDSVRYRRKRSEEEGIEGSTSKSQTHSRKRGVGGVDTDADAEGEGGESDVVEGILDRGGSNKGQRVSPRLPYVNAQATFGALVLSLATAAAIWRVKRE